MSASWLSATILLAVTTVGAEGMRHALERGDLDEVARQAAIAGPVAVSDALAAPDRISQLAGVIAAPAIGDPALMLPTLAMLAGGPDRRTAIPAARAARTIALALAAVERDDDIADEDVADWRAAFVALALRSDRWIEVRTAALDTAAALAPAALGFDLAAVLVDPDPALRREAVALVPQPAPESLRAPLVAAILTDTDPGVALGAAQALCADLVTDDPAPILSALGEPGLDRLRTLAASPADVVNAGAWRDVARCLTADHSPRSIAAARAIATRLKR